MNDITRQYIEHNIKKLEWDLHKAGESRATALDTLKNIDTRIAHLDETISALRESLGVVVFTS